MNFTHSPKLHSLFCIIAGGLAPLSFSPLNLWPCGILSVLGLYALLQGLTSKKAFWTGWFYGLGFFGVGVSWVYVSINVYSNAPPILAALTTGAFVACLAFLFSLQCCLYQRFFKSKAPAFSFAAVWVLMEWFRVWFLTGFPWLYLGYAHLSSPLSGLAPVLGVMGMSFIVALSATLLLHLIRRQDSKQWYKQWKLGTVLVALWILPLLLKTITWVNANGDSLSIGIVQANIDQNEKFDSSFTQQSLDLHYTLSQPLWNNDIVIWPETAIPVYYEDSALLIASLAELASNNQSALISGIFSNENNETYNSVMSVGFGDGLYHKQKIVPFGEYQPLGSFMDTLGISKLFNLPLSGLSKGSAQQDNLQAAGYSVSAFICYEVVFPDFVRSNAGSADFLVTISNDTWFGASFGPLQHLEMAAMRALENGRYMVRATNNGVSAIINHKGEIVSRTKQFQAETLKGRVEILTGRTPFSRWGSYPILILCGLILIFVRARMKVKS